jgi:hypothetical protein
MSTVATVDVLTGTVRKTFEPEAKGLTMLGGCDRSPRACSSVDRASASGAWRLRVHPNGTPSETRGVLRSFSPRVALPTALAPEPTPTIRTSFNVAGCLVAGRAL